MWELRKEIHYQISIYIRANNQNQDKEQTTLKMKRCDKIFLYYINILKEIKNSLKEETENELRTNKNCENYKTNLKLVAAFKILGSQEKIAETIMEATKVC